MSKILEFGDNKEPLSVNFYPTDEIIVRPLVDEWWWIGKDEQYKGIYAYYAPTKIPWAIEQEAINSWAWGLEPGGLLHFVVPGFEYLCRRMLGPLPEVWVKAMLLNAYNHYTMPQLRIMFHRAGLQVLKAKTGAAQIDFMDDVREVEQHYIVGMKPDD